MSQAIVPTEGQALSPVTGEVMDLRSFPSIGLAQQMVAVAENRERLKDYEAAISDELVRRMDANASWTMREGEYEVTTSSPTAGTIEYVPDALEEALHQLRWDNKISDEAADAACKPLLTIEVEVPFSGPGHPQDLAMKLRQDIEGAQVLFDVPVRVVRADWRTKPSLSGIKALEKLPGVKETLDGAAVAVKPPRRRVSVKRKP